MSETTASGWYYAQNGERVGPRSLDEVRSMVASGALDADALVWTAGMREWARVGDFPILSPEWAPHAPPPVSTEPARASWVPPVARTQGPRPWLRVGARLLDTILFLFVSGLVLRLALPEYAERITTASGQPDPALGFAMFLSLVPIEAIVLAAFGTTPGKSLFGIRVVPREGDRLSFAQSLSRAARVMVLGLGLGLTPLTLIAGIASFMRLRSRGITLWDEQMGLRVEHAPVTPGGAMTAGALLLLFLLMLSFAFSQMAAL